MSNAVAYRSDDGRLHVMVQMRPVVRWEQSAEGPTIGFNARNEVVSAYIDAPRALSRDAWGTLLASHTWHLQLLPIVSRWIEEGITGLQDTADDTTNLREFWRGRMECLERDRLLAARGQQKADPRMLRWWVPLVVGLVFEPEVVDRLAYASEGNVQLLKVLLLGCFEEAYVNGFKRVQPQHLHTVISGRVSTFLNAGSHAVQKFVQEWKDAMTQEAVVPVPIADEVENLRLGAKVTSPTPLPDASHVRIRLSHLLLQWFRGLRTAAEPQVAETDLPPPNRGSTSARVAIPPLGPITLRAPSVAPPPPARDSGSTPEGQS